MSPNAASTPTSAGVTVPPEVWAQMQQLLAVFATQSKPSVSPSNDSHNEEEALEVKLALSPRPINSIPPIDTIITSPACKNNINTSSPTGLITKLNKYNYSTGICDMCLLSSPQLSEKNNHHLLGLSCQQQQSGTGACISLLRLDKLSSPTT
ncbi:hypothetical protein PCANC_10599 [Puccinia coronata f. sp. avenae]|uniref:Uncharacterized protein n=1 Tax=Puccinia coronata f. sp. avenae TaxID=200324 RepID=A0A2N5VR61_9BASI|nr:hypothetical protein PCANC_10599 [Puccinia coronata f. sp. avenae]